MNAPSDNIRIFTTPTFSAYLRFMMWAAFRQVRFLIPFAILLVICFLFAPLFPYEQQGAVARYRASLGALFLPGIVFVFLPLGNYFGARKRWQNASELRAPRTYVFRDAGVEIVSDSFSSQIDWTLVVTADKHRDQILLGTAQKQFYLVPVNDFESQEQLARFVVLVKSKVPNCRL